MLRQLATTTYPIAFQLVDATDHVTPETGKAPTVTLSKAGSAFAAAAGVVTELSDGWYQLAGNATDRDTLGNLIVKAVAAGCEDSYTPLEIVDYDPFASSITPAGYGTVEGVAWLAKIWTQNGSWVNDVEAYGPTAAVTGTNPSLSQVVSWLDEVSALVDTALAGAGFTVPVTQATALTTINMFVNSIVADLCHAANSSGRLFTQKIIERGLSPMIIITQQINKWAEEQTAGFRQLGVPWTQAPVPPAFSVEAERQL